MKALVLESYGPAPRLHVAERPLPELGEGDVLVRMAASPINPSDVAFLRGEYGVTKALPVVPGFEGAGVVVAAGASAGAQALAGARVACVAPLDGDGTWAEYTRAPARACIPLVPATSLEQGAALLVNPVTAYALVRDAKRRGGGGIVQTAASSQLARMIARHARGRRMTVVDVVRRPEQAERLRADGAAHVLDASRDDFEPELRRATRELGITLALDAVAGSMTGVLLRALPRGSRVVVLGALSREPSAIDPLELIFGRKSVEGFLLGAWLRAQRPSYTRRLFPALQRGLGRGFGTQILARFPLERVGEALALQASQASLGKVLFVPWPDATPDAGPEAATSGAP